MATYRVTGPRPVAGVRRGGTVTLDDRTNVAALIEAGHLTPVADAPAPAAKPKKTTGGES
jgi:hypothetical protein